MAHNNIIIRYLHCVHLTGMYTETFYSHVYNVWRAFTRVKLFLTLYLKYMTIVHVHRAAYSNYNIYALWLHAINCMYVPAVSIIFKLCTCKVCFVHQYSLLPEHVTCSVQYKYIYMYVISLGLIFVANHEMCSSKNFIPSQSWVQSCNMYSCMQDSNFFRNEHKIDIQRNVCRGHSMTRN